MSIRQYVLSCVFICHRLHKRIAVRWALYSSSIKFMNNNTHSIDFFLSIFVVVRFAFAMPVFPFQMKKSDKEFIHSEIRSLYICGTNIKSNFFATKSHYLLFELKMPFIHTAIHICTFSSSFCCSILFLVLDNSIDNTIYEQISFISTWIHIKLSLT